MPQLRPLKWVASVVLAGAASGAFADVPDATTFVQLSVFETATGPANGISLSNANLGTQRIGCMGNLAIEGTFCAQTVSDLVPAAFVSAFAISDAFAQGRAAIQLSYSYEVVGPELAPGSFIPLELAGTLGCNVGAAGAGFPAGGCKAVLSLFGEDTNLQAYQKTITGNDPYHETVLSNFVLPNRVYTVKMAVDVQSVGSSLAFGWIDPLLAIELDDPSYSLVLSAGVANAANFGVFPQIPDPTTPVPEPSSAMLLLLGSAACLTWKRLQGRRA